MGVGLVRSLKGVLALPWAFCKAVALVLRHRPRAVLGVGGYAGGPLVLVASLMRTHTVILEPNARPGFTNKLLRFFARRAACSFDQARAELGRRAVLTGNPVREGFARLPRKEHGAPFDLLVFGGSQGSRVLNRALMAALPALPGAERLRIVHQTGPAMEQEVGAAYQAQGREGEVVAFLDDMEARFAAADLIVCRSGATTCAELTVAGKAAVLVPFAGATGDHQTLNARALEEAGAASMIEESDLTGETVARRVREILETPGTLEAMEQASRRLGRPDAAARVADLLVGTQC
jgi:UDP-N-acetylglucosamine--N-acetylmuramyl-(pentapeptide) pyrophosphoryl-undecaprenol N-acetylglucosamine transferase